MRNLWKKNVNRKTFSENNKGNFFFIPKPQAVVINLRLIRKLCRFMQNQYSQLRQFPCVGKKQFQELFWNALTPYTKRTVAVKPKKINEIIIFRLFIFFHFQIHLLLAMVKKCFIFSGSFQKICSIDAKLSTCLTFSSVGKKSLRDWIYRLCSNLLMIYYYELYVKCLIFQIEEDWNIMWKKFRVKIDIILLRLTGLHHSDEYFQSGSNRGSATGGDY